MGTTPRSVVSSMTRLLSYPLSIAHVSRPADQREARPFQSVGSSITSWTGMRKNSSRRRARQSASAAECSAGGGAPTVRDRSRPGGRRRAGEVAELVRTVGTSKNSVGAGTFCERPRGHEPSPAARRKVLKTTRTRVSSTGFSHIGSIAGATALPSWLFYLLAFSVILDIISRTEPHDHVVKHCSCGKRLPPFAVAARDPWCSSGCARKAFGVKIQPGATYTAALKPGERTRLQQLRMQVAESRRERVLEAAEKYVSVKR
jgi:hypothetical protein